MIKRCLVLLSLIISVSTSMLAQQEISGKVLDENNEPIIGANVIVKGTTNGTITDLDGAFKITAPEDASLLISFVGYATQEIAIAENTNFEIKLLPDENALEEVVITALGIERDKKALGYAVQDVKADELTTTGDANIATALQGKVAGVIINQSGSGVGGTSRIEIRGASSLSDNSQPLIVVDGVPFNSSDQGEAGIWGGVESSGGMADINPQDIENISVLKGPNAAALYGSRAGNGVILISTKKGTNKGLNVNYDGNVTISELAYYLDLQDEYGQGQEGVYDRFGTSSWGPKMEGQMLESWTGETIPYSSQTDRLKDFTRMGVSQNHNVSLSAGGERGTIRVSFAKSDENGIYNGHNVDKSNFDLRAVYDITDWLNVDAKASYFLTKGQNRPEMGYYSYISYFNAMPMNIRTVDLKPGYEISPTGEHVEKLYTTANANYRNPYFLEAQTYNSDERYRGFGYLAANIKFSDELKLRLKYGLDFFREGANNGYYFADNVSSNRPDYNTRQKFFKEENAEFLLSYNKDFEDFNLSLNFGGNRMYNYSQTLTSHSGLLPDEGNYFLGYGSNISSEEGFSEEEVQSLYGFAQVGYKNMVYMDVTARNDWSSTLPINNNSYFYPSVSLSGIISEMVTLPDWFNYAKVRGSWAQVGKGTTPYNVNQVYTVGTWNFGLLNGNIPSIKVNEDLQPEISSSIEFGADLRLLNNRLGIDFTYYDERTKNQIFAVPTDQSTGYEGKLINAGLITNKGVEILLNTVPVKTQDLTFEVNFNFAKNTTMVEELDEELKVYSFGTLNNSVGAIAIEGEKMGDIRGSVYLRDDNGAIIVGADGLPRTQDSLVSVGNIQPDFTGSIMLKATYKGFYLSALVAMQQGGDIYSSTEAAATASGNSVRTTANNRMAFFYEGLKEDGSVNNELISAQHYWGRISGITEEFIYDASYMKLREVAIGYAFPKELLAKIPSQPIKSARVSLVGRNLFYFYKHTPGTIPDASAYSNSYSAQAFDFSPVPATRTYGFSINLGF